MRLRHARKWEASSLLLFHFADVIGIANQFYTSFVPSFSSSLDSTPEAFCCHGAAFPAAAAGPALLDAWLALGTYSSLADNRLNRESVREGGWHHHPAPGFATSGRALPFPRAFLLQPLGVHTPPTAAFHHRLCAALNSFLSPVAFLSLRSSSSAFLLAQLCRPHVHSPGMSQAP